MAQFLAVRDAIGSLVHDGDATTSLGACAQHAHKLRKLERESRVRECSSMREGRLSTAWVSSRARCWGW
jgi:hypothetical protein